LNTLAIFIESVRITHEFVYQYPGRPVQPNAICNITSIVHSKKIISISLREGYEGNRKYLEYFNTSYCDGEYLSLPDTNTWYLLMDRECEDITLTAVNHCGEVSEEEGRFSITMAEHYN